METRAARSRGEVVALVVVALTAAAFLALASGRITARYGDSDDGINAAVWSANARALRELGPVTSRLGGLREDGTRYATHPPTIVVATALAQIVGGDHPWSSRAPAWLATVAALALLYALGRRAGFGAAAAAGAVVAVGLTPMVLVYGAMLDTPVVCLPFGLLVAMLWYRAWRASQPASDASPAPASTLSSTLSSTPASTRVQPPGGTAGQRTRVAEGADGDGDDRGKPAPALLWLGLAAAAAGLAGWQAAVLTALCGLSLAVRAVRRRGEDAGRRALGPAAALLIGGAVGVGLSLSWSWWVYGDFHTLATKFSGRSGSSGSVGLGDMVSFQVPWLVDLLGLSTIGLVGCLVALRDRRVRALAALALTSVALYAVIFRQAAAGHQYWNYWAVFPAAVGWGYLFDRLARDLQRQGGAHGARRAVGAIAVVVAGVCLFNLLRHDRAATEIADGQRAADLVATATFPSDQTLLPYIGQPYRPDAWISYNTGREAVVVSSADQLRALAADHPDQLVLVLGSCDAGDASFDFCASIVAPGIPHVATGNNPPQLVAAAELVHRLDTQAD